MGWDDNGLPTERRVQNYFGVRCDPSLPYDPALRRRRPRPARTTSRSPVVAAELHRALRAAHRRGREGVRGRCSARSASRWTGRRRTRRSASARARASQRAFLRLVRRGQAYTAEAPTMWDVDFRTAVAQAEIEDREIDGAYHRIAFDLDGRRGVGRDRDVAARADPGVRRPGRAPRPTSGTRARRHDGASRRCSRAPVPIVAHELADPEKGTGVAMICTFGDVTDVAWWRELRLPARVVISRDGTIARATVGRAGLGVARRRGRATRRMAELAGLPREAGAARGSPSCCATRARSSASRSRSATS